jgi:hypothetical protein
VTVNASERAPLPIWRAVRKAILRAKPTVSSSKSTEEDIAMTVLEQQVRTNHNKLYIAGRWTPPECGNEEVISR